MASIKSVVTNSDTDEMFIFFKELGCCDYCSLRFTGTSEAKTFIKFDTAKNGMKNTNEENSEGGNTSKRVKSNPCLACLGVTESLFLDEAARKVIDGAKQEGFELSTFNLAVTLPIAYQIRAQSLWYYIVESFPHSFKSLFPFGSVSVGPKDLIKWLLAPKIECLTSMRFQLKSDFIINLSLAYQDNCKECSPLIKLFPERCKGGSRRGNISRKAVEEKFSKSLSEEEFREVFAVPPAVPGTFARLEAVSFTHNSIYIAGRYCKLSRSLPQTPWIVGNERKLDSSVEEKITVPLQSLVSTIVSRFGASGREDVDVRMLGRGRPFTVELVNPKRTKLSFDMLRKLEDEINILADGQIIVRDLQVVPKVSLVDLKCGEESKCKVYEALCIVSAGYTQRLAALSNMFPLDLDQMTPVRVLHRRAVALRKRTVHSLTITPLPLSSPIQVSGSELVVVELRTQAGTYVKEFIHGDLGRTKPSLRSLARIPFIDILALDVKDIELDWPPSIKYSQEQ